MNTENKHLKNLEEIRSLMERSTKFISLSGLSGISAGIIAITGAFVAKFYLNFDTRFFSINSYFKEQLYQHFSGKSMAFLIIDAVIVLILALLSAYYFSYKKAKKNNLKFWTPGTKRLLINLLYPLLVGGILCIIMIYYQFIFFIAPFTLIFYGLALINASSFTFNEIRYLGISEVILGLMAICIIESSLLFWTIGFGLLHLIYGTFMYIKYDRPKSEL